MELNKSLEMFTKDEKFLQKFLELYTKLEKSFLNDANITEAQ